MPAALLHRQRVLLSLLRELGGKCTKMSLLKQMFILCKEEVKRDIYDFHPYLFGPFSLTLYADLRALERRGYLRQTEAAVFLKKDDAKAGDRMELELNVALSAVARKYGKLSDTTMLRQVYARYPYFAIRNPRCGKRYSVADPRHDPLKQKPTIFSIGYEGKSIDRFLDELILHNIHVLVDIRNNPVSMKYGFSGKKLREYCTARGMEYLGIPELGIPSIFRQNLVTLEDYKQLFVRYRHEVLPRSTEHLECLRTFLGAKKRLALMCFEKDRTCCHRNDAAIALSTYCNDRYELSHI